MEKRSTYVICGVLIAVALTACSKPEAVGKVPGVEGAAAETAAPSTDETRQTYWRTCHSCHGSGVGGAPKAGDALAWAPRLDKGMDTLLDHAINGYRAMPPRGLCYDCSEADFAALIQLMSGAGEIAEPE
ncbi:c-type cytochrome [Microbulbifer hainanensis]|uniref:c-type cytochrome n=1 Tax=Microbulbifer hainanensis TaxID=2735675 RepID=UPI001867B220|nr:c-type cytochrome [Microbulbifer hainanensis]